jgi:hypothetical protein
VSDHAEPRHTKLAIDFFAGLAVTILMIGD